MRKFRKVFNLKLISLFTAGLFLLTSSAYGMGLFQKSHLRKQLDFNNPSVVTERWKEAVGKISATDIDDRGTRTPLASNTGLKLFRPFLPFLAAVILSVASVNAQTVTTEAEASIFMEQSSVEKDGKVLSGIIQALGKEGTPEAISRLIGLGNDAERLIGLVVEKEGYYSQEFTNIKLIKVTVAEALIVAGAKDIALEYLKEARASDYADEYVVRWVARALGKINTEEAETYLIEWSANISGNYEEYDIIQSLVSIGTEKTENRLIEWSRTEEGSYIGKSIAEALGSIGTEKSEARLLEWSRTKEDSFVKGDIVKALASIGTEKSETRLIEWSRTKEDSFVKGDIVKALASIGTEKAEARLIEWSREYTEEQQGGVGIDVAAYLKENIAQGLSSIGTKEALVRLLEWFEEERFSAVYYRNRDASPIETIAYSTVRFLKRFPEITLSDDMKIDMMWALMEIVTGNDARETESSEESEAFIIGLLKDKSHAVRLNAASLSGRLLDERAVEPLIELLKDPYPAVRNIAATSLGKIGDERAVEPLIEILKDEDAGASKDKRDYFRRQAAEALINIGKIAVEPLIELLKDKDSGVRILAVSALHAIGDERAVEPLIELLKDPYPAVRNIAATSLGKIGDERAVGPLIELLKDEVFDIRYNVVWALGEIGTKEAAAGLIELAREEDVAMQGAIALSLSTIFLSNTIDGEDAAFLMESIEGTEVEKYLSLTLIANMDKFERGSSLYNIAEESSEKYLPKFPLNKEILSDGQINVIVITGQDPDYNFFRQYNNFFSHDLKQDKTVPGVTPDGLKQAFYSTKLEQRNGGMIKTTVRNIKAEDVLQLKKAFYKAIEDEGVDYILIGAHSTDLMKISETMLRDKKEGKVKAKGNKIIHFQGCNSAMHCSDRIAKFSDNRYQFIGTIYLTSVADGVPVALSAIKGIAKSESWKEIEEGWNGLNLDVKKNHISSGNPKMVKYIDFDGDGVPFERDRDGYTIMQREEIATYNDMRPRPDISEPRQGLFSVIGYLTSRFEANIRFLRPFRNLKVPSYGEFSYKGWESDYSDTEKFILSVDVSESDDETDGTKYEVTIEANVNYSLCNELALKMMAMYELHNYLSERYEPARENGVSIVNELDSPRGLSYEDKTYAFIKAFEVLARELPNISRFTGEEENLTEIKALFEEFKLHYDIPDEITFDIAYKAYWSKEIAGTTRTDDTDEALDIVKEAFMFLGLAPALENAPIPADNYDNRLHGPHMPEMHGEILGALYELQHNI